MLEIIVSVIVYLAGAVSEHETQGAITRGIMYQDGNVTVVECENSK